MRFLMMILFMSILSAQFEAKLTKDFQIEQSVPSPYGYQIKIERGVIYVPNNRKNPSSYITIPYLKLFSLSKSPGPPIFKLAGGPGDSGFHHKRTIQAHYAETFLNYSDVIFFDQRGAASSEPDLQLEDGFELPLNRSISDPAFMDAYSAQLRTQIEQLKKNGINLNDYNTAENAADIDDMRRLLGYNKIILWGHSYGSHLGLAYINSYEQHVERAIFSGVNGLNDRFRIPSQSDSVFHRIHRYVENDSILSKQVPNFLGLVRKVHADFKQRAKWVKLDFKEAHNYENRGTPKKIALWFRSLWTDSLDIKLGLAELQLSAMFQIHGSNTLSNILNYYRQISQGNYRQIAMDNVRLVKLAHSNSPLGRKAMIYAMAIASYASQDRLDAIRNDDKDAFIAKVLNFPFIDKGIHKAMNIEYLPDSFRLQKKSNLPVLMFNGDLDIRTTVDAAQAVLTNFPNGKLLIVKGASHNFLPLHISIRDAMENFIQGKVIDIDSIDTKIEFRKLSEPRLAAKLQSLSSDSLLTDFKKLARDSVSLFDESTLNSIAYYYMNTDENFPKAKAILELNLELFPDRSNPYDSMGELYFRIEDFETARTYYQKSLDLNPLNRNAVLYKYIMTNM